MFKFKLIADKLNCLFKINLNVTFNFNNKGNQAKKFGINIIYAQDQKLHHFKPFYSPIFKSLYIFLINISRVNYNSIMDLIALFYLIKSHNNK